MYYRCQLTWNCSPRTVTAVHSFLIKHNSIFLLLQIIFDFHYILKIQFPIMKEITLGHISEHEHNWWVSTDLVTRVLRATPRKTKDGTMIKDMTTQSMHTME